MGWYHKIFRNTNLDISLGAGVNCFFFARIHGVDLDYEVYGLLFLAVWVIYTIDRLLDTRKELKEILPRHRFHIRNRKPLLVICLVFLIISLLLLPRVEESIVKAGLGMSALMGIYLLLIWKKINVPKEIIIALLYTSGVALAPLVLSDQTEIRWMILFQHSILAFTNLVIISWFEREVDKKNGVYNITNLIGRKTPVLINSLFFLVLACGFFAGREYGWVFQVPLLLMWVTFVIVWAYRELFGRNDLYGSLLDGAFFLPLIIFFFR